jgi:hypothetical protein
MTKKRRTYHPRVFDGWVIMSDEIERIHRKSSNSSTSMPSPVRCAR